MANDRDNPILYSPSRPEPCEGIHLRTATHLPVSRSMTSCRPPGLAQDHLRRPHALDSHSPLRSDIMVVVVSAKCNPHPTGHQLTALSALLHAPNIQTAYASPLVLASVSVSASKTAGRNCGENRGSRLPQTGSRLTSFRITSHLHDLVPALPCLQSSTRRVLPKLARVEAEHSRSEDDVIHSAIRRDASRMHSWSRSPPMSFTRLKAVSLPVIILRHSPCTKGLSEVGPCHAWPRWRAAYGRRYCCPLALVSLSATSSRAMTILITSSTQYVLLALILLKCPS